MKTKNTNGDFNFSIKKPCSKSFQNFEKTDQGGFCNFCNKEVIDFRNFSKNELIEYFQNENKRVCGVLSNEQINTTHSKKIVEVNKTQKYIYKSIFGFSILTLFSFNNIQSQNIEKDSIKFETTNTITNSANQEYLEGVIYNINGPLAGALIVIKNKDIKTISDKNGKFSFSKKISKKDILIISYIGHITREIKISDLLGKEIMLQAYDDKIEFVTVGEINIKKTNHSYHTFFEKIKNLFK